MGECGFAQETGCMGTDLGDDPVEDSSREGFGSDSEEEEDEIKK